MRPIDASRSFAKGERSFSEAAFDEAFRDPPAPLRGKPFWSWNGELEREELLRQIDVVREMGMGGMFMHSRNGLKTEYLGKAWFELVNACAEKAARLGLEGWLYDEDRWPSGSAGGLVTREPTYRMRSIVLSEFGPGETIEWPEAKDLIEAHLADLDGLDLKHYVPVDRGSLEICPDGQRLLLFVREVHPSHSFYNGGSYLDTLNREATDRFIEVTHEKYRERCGQHFGKGIKGIFTDEPHRGFILCDTVSQPGSRRSSHAIPYTERLFDEFAARFGYPLHGRLPELFFQLGGNRLSQLKWHYVELLQQLFIENWARPCLNWCKEQGLVLTGHVLHEDTLAAQVVPCGSLFRYYEEMTWPGIDVLGLHNNAYWVAKQVVSVARQQGQPFVLSELYGGTGWQTDFLEHKKIGDWQAFLGVNLRCHHLSWYTMAGESKRDFPASIFHQSAWYLEYEYVETYFARIHYVLQQGEPDCDVLVVHPGESLWAQFHLGWASWLKSESAAVKAVEKKFETLFRWFTDSQIDFDYGDEEQLGRLATVEMIDDEPFLGLGLMRYRVVVVAGLETIRASTVELLEEFIKAGGSVVFVGDPPSHLDAEPSEVPAKLGQLGVRTPWEKPAAMGAVSARSEQLLSVNGGFGAEGVISHVRRMEDGDLYIALVNTTGRSLAAVALQVPVAGRIEQLDCRKGSVQALAAEATRDGLGWTVSFRPWEERVFRFVANVPDGGTAPAAESPGSGAEVTVTGPYRYELSEPNALVLDQARYRVGEGAWQPDTDVLRIDEVIREELGWPQRTGKMVQLWCAEGQDREGPGLELAYSFQVRECPVGLELVLEQPERWEIDLNGTAVTAADVSAWFIDISLKRVALPREAIRVGENRLNLRTRLTPGTDLEAVYLIGSFGVFREGAGFTLGSLPHRVKAGDLVEQGFPFYTGVFTYQCAVPSGLGQGPAVLSLPHFAGACARLRSGDGDELLAFPPFETEWIVEKEAAEFSLDIFLTRQNFFGPFHRIPKEHGFVSPESFRVWGDRYTKEHQLFPSGLLQAPVVTK